MGNPRTLDDIEQLKRETEDDLRAARERRLDREARERRDGPILAAFDRMAKVERGLAELKHAPFIETRELDFDLSDARGDE